MFGSVTILSLCMIVGVFSDDECKVPDCPGENVIKALVPLLSNEEFPGEEFLKEHCEEAVKMFDCGMGFLEKCPQVVDDLTFMPILRTVHAYVSNLCTEGSQTRADYLSIIECLNKVDDDLDRCANRTTLVMDQFHDSQLSVFENDIIDHEEQERKVLCLSVPLFSSCALPAIQNKCKEGSVKTARTVWSELVQPIYDEMCPLEKLVEYSGEFVEFTLTKFLPDSLK